jgi:hypothetical protein
LTRTNCNTFLCDWGRILSLHWTNLNGFNCRLEKPINVTNSNSMWNVKSPTFPSFWWPNFFSQCNFDINPSSIFDHIMAVLQRNIMHNLNENDNRFLLYFNFFEKPQYVQFHFFLWNLMDIFGIVIELLLNFGFVNFIAE